MAMFIGGKSTDPEVDALVKAISIEPGLRVSYRKVAEISGVSRILIVSER